MTLLVVLMRRKPFANTCGLPDFNVATGKPATTDTGAVKYGPHRWQGGGERVKANEPDAFDLWAAFEIVPGEAKIKPAKEYVDNLDPDTGEPIEGNEAVLRSVAHKQGNWHRSVHVLVLSKDGKLILQKRGENIHASAGKWDISVGGHVSAGQSPLEAALRELKEELAIDATPEQLHEVGHKYKKTAMADANEEGHYDENGIFIYHSNKTPNNEFNSLYYIIVDKTVDEINEGIKRQAEISADEAKKEVARVAEITIEDVLRDIDEPTARKGYASGIVQYIMHKEARAALEGVALSLRQQASGSAQRAEAISEDQQRAYTELLCAA